MRKKLSRMLAFTLASAMMLSSLSLSALAAPVEETALAEEMLVEAESEVAEAENETEIETEIETDETLAETEAEETWEADDVDEADEEELADVEAIAETEAEEIETEEAETEAEAVPMEEEAEALEAVSVESILTAKDSYGNIYKVFAKSAANGVLFLSADIKLPELTVTVASAVTKASVGTLGADHVLSGAFKKSGDKVTLTASDNKTYTITVMQSKLPTLHLTLKDITLAQINAGSKDTKYKGNSLTLYDPAGNSMTAKKVQIKGRGNSTWSLGNKKPYQIKFNEATAVLGMEPAEKWILMANAFEDTLIRNAVGFTLAKKLGMACAPDYRFVDLFVDGEYIGNYMICEKCDIGAGRINLTHEDGVVTEFDQAFYASEEFTIRNAMTNHVFTLKECISEGKETEVLAKFSAKVDRMMKFLLSTSPETITLSEINQYIDIESVAQYALTTEFTRNIESWHTSFHWYTDGPDDVLHFGPVWDFDSSLGNYGTYTDPYGFCKNAYTYYQLIVNIPAVSDYLFRYYESHKTVFRDTAALAGILGDQLTASAAMNYTRWDLLGKPNVKPNHIPYHKTYAEGIAFLKNWLNERYRCYRPDAAFFVTLQNGMVNVSWKPDTSYASVAMAIWSATNEQDDIVRVNMTKNADGRWTASVPYSAFKHEGEFRIHITGDGKFVDHTTIPIGNYKRIEVAQNSWMVEENISAAQNYSQIRTAVWSQENGQDDLKWYEAVRQPNGKWKLVVDLSGHTGMGIYNFHTYGVANGKSVMIGAETVNVTDKTLATYNGVDYSPVYNYDYYMSRHADLKRAYGNKPAGAAKHFFTYGVKEGRQASEKFNAGYYRDNYADLKRAYGDNLFRYYTHYCLYGVKEGREAKYLIPMDGNLNYSPVYNFDYYINKYPDLKKAFGTDQAKAFRHFLNNGMREGRQGSASFNCSIYKARYADLKKAFGDKNDLYFKHYIQYGMKEGRSAI